MTLLGEVINIKENANPVRFNLGLEQEGRSKFPNCFDIIQPGKGRDGRWKTGLDEDAISILSIKDAAYRGELREKVKAERESLESVTGFDLSGRSSFWDDYFIEVNPKKPLNLSNPTDRIRYHVLMASGEIAPNLKETANADYFNAKYYLSRKHEDVSEKLAKKKRYNESAAALIDLMKTPDKAILIGRYLNLPVSNNTPYDNMYDAFQSYLDSDEKIGSIDKFMRALTKPVEELSIKLIFDDGLKYNVIRLRDGYYQRGNITYGKSIKEAIEFFTDVKNSGELLSVQDEVENKRKFG